MPVFAYVVLSACATPQGPEPAPHVLLPGQADMTIGPDGNSVILDAPDGLVVIDSGRHESHAQRILAHADEVGRPVAVLVNTHWHMDHTTGNGDILARHPQAQLVATGAISGALGGFLAQSRQAAEQRLTDPAVPADARARTLRFLAAIGDRAAMVPAQPVEEDREGLLGGRSFRLHVAHAAATEADLWLVDPAEDLAVVGDLVVGQVPFFDTACEEGWRRALGAIAAERWTLLIPGHGAPMDRAQFGRWRAAFDAWLDCAASDAAPARCAEGWMRDAAGFYTEGEREDARFLAEAYVAEVIRKPEERMAYCAG